MSKHKVRVHNWLNGVLQVSDNFFENLELAMDFANTTSGHSVKVFNENQELVHHVQNAETPTNTYA